MTIPTPRAALKQLLARLDETTDKNGPVPAWMDSYCTAVQALKAKPERPSLADIRQLCVDNELLMFVDATDFDTVVVAILEIVRTALSHWDRPTTPPPPGPGGVGEVATWLLSMRELAGEHNPEERRQFTRAATLLQQQAAELAALRGVPVAVEELLEALIKAEATLTDVVEGESPVDNSRYNAHNYFADQCSHLENQLEKCEKLLTAIRPAIRRHRTAPPLPAPQPGEAQP